MLAMGCIKSLIIDKVSNGKVPIDMTSFLTQVVLVDLQLESGEPVSTPGCNRRHFSYKLLLSFVAIFSFLLLAESPPRDLQITAYKQWSARAKWLSTVFGCK